MKVRGVGLWVLGMLITAQSFGQRIVNQTSINQFEPVSLYNPVSLIAFDPAVMIGTEFPDFQTVSTENEVFDLDGILLDAIEEQKVPIIAFGRPSCNQLRDLYQHILLHVLEETGSEVSFFHLANSIEAHATNGYLTPYYGIFNGEIYPAPQIPFVNDGYTFEQPFFGNQLFTLSAEFVTKMVETGVGEEEEFEDITVLIDSPEGGFTQAFSGPAIVWVLDPFSGKVVYESVDFQCAIDPIQGCALEQQALINTIREVQELFNLVDIQEVTNQELIEVKDFNLLGQDSRSGLRLFYNPKTRQKILKPAQ